MKIISKFQYFFVCVGEISLFFKSIILLIYKVPLRFKNIIYQMLQLGVNSLPIAGIVGLFAGMILCIHGAEQLIKFGQSHLIGMMVAKSLTREIGPTLMSVVVVGRVGSAIAAELGTMKITEQIDALHSMAIDPISYLVIPRFIAITLMLPFLTIFADILGIIGGYIVGIYQLKITSSVFINSIKNHLVLKDIFGGLFKAFIFGAIISIISCYFGFKTEGGAEEVGKSTTLAVVISAILIIIVNYFITTVLYFFF